VTVSFDKGIEEGDGEDKGDGKGEGDGAGVSDPGGFILFFGLRSNIVAAPPFLPPRPFSFSLEFTASIFRLEYISLGSNM
jgi:hypothetical protein